MIGRLKHDARLATTQLQGNPDVVARARVALRMALLRLENLISSQEFDDFCDELGV